jgi:hypothetical protein
MITMNARYLYYGSIVVLTIFFIIYFYNRRINKPKFALEVDPTKGTTDICGIMYSESWIEAAY